MTHPKHGFRNWSSISQAPTKSPKPFREKKNLPQTQKEEKKKGSLEKEKLHIYFFFLYLTYEMYEIIKSFYTNFGN